MRVLYIIILLLAPSPPKLLVGFKKIIHRCLLSCSTLVLNFLIFNINQILNTLVLFRSILESKRIYQFLFLKAVSSVKITQRYMSKSNMFVSHLIIYLFHHLIFSIKLVNIRIIKMQ